MIDLAMLGLADPRLHGRPALLWLWALLMIEPFVTVAVAGKVNGLVVGAALLAGILVAAVLYGSRAAWVIALVFQVIVVLPIGEIHIWALALNLVGLGCLLAPDVRRFALSNRHGAAATRRSRSEPTPRASALC